MTLIVTSPTRLDLVHYHKDDFELTITVVNSDSSPFDFTGYTGTMYIRYTQEYSTNLMSIDVTFQDNTIIISSPIGDYSVLQSPTDYYYELIITDSDGSPKAWIGGKYRFTVKPTSNQLSTASLQFTTTSLTIETNASAVAYTKSSFKFGVALTGTKNGVNKTFVIPVTSGKSLVTNTEQIFWGLPLQRDVGYTISDATVTMTDAPESGDSLFANWIEE